MIIDIIKRHYVAPALSLIGFLLVSCGTTSAPVRSTIDLDDVELLALSMEAVAVATRDSVNTVSRHQRSVLLRASITQEIEIAVGDLTKESAIEPLRNIDLEIFLCEPLRRSKSIRSKREYLARVGAALSENPVSPVVSDSLVDVIKQIGSRPSLDISAPMTMSFDAIYNRCNVPAEYAINEHYRRGGGIEAGADISQLGPVSIVLSELLLPILSYIGDAIEERKRVEAIWMQLNDEANRMAIEDALSNLESHLKMARERDRWQALVNVIRAREQVLSVVTGGLDADRAINAAFAESDSCRMYQSDSTDYMSFARCHDHIWNVAESSIVGFLDRAQEYDEFVDRWTPLVGSVYRLEQLWEGIRVGSVDSLLRDDIRVLALILVELLVSVRDFDDALGEVEENEIDEIIASIIHSLFGES